MLEVEGITQNVIFQMMMTETTISIHSQRMMRSCKGGEARAGAHGGHHSGWVSFFGIIFLAEHVTWTMWPGSSKTGIEQSFINQHLAILECILGLLRLEEVKTKA